VSVLFVFSPFLKNILLGLSFSKRFNTLDGKTDLLTDLLGGKQGWKYPVTLLTGLVWSKSLKVILIKECIKLFVGY